MIFVDSNIPMYLVGADDQLKHDTQVKVERAIASGEELVTSAEVLQEICHRYAAINLRGAIQPAFDALLRIVDEVLPVERVDVEAARDEILRHPTRSARDALHIEMIRRYRIQRVMSFDKGFDRLPGIERI